MTDRTLSDSLRRQVDLLCTWIEENPHVRGSINGMAAQIKHALYESVPSGREPQPVALALQKARQTIVDLRTVLDPFDAPAKVVWAASDHTLQTIDAALSAGVEPQPVVEGRTDDVLVSLIRPEGYEDVHDDYVLEDARINPAFEPMVVYRATQPA